MVNVLSHPGKPPISLRGTRGLFPDDMDRFRWMDGFEDPAKWEEAIKRAFDEAQIDPELAKLLKTHYLEQDVAASFASFRRSGVPEMVDNLLLRLGVSRQMVSEHYGKAQRRIRRVVSAAGFPDLNSIQNDPVESPHRSVQEQ